MKSKSVPKLFLPVFVSVYTKIRADGDGRYIIDLYMASDGRILHYFLEMVLERRAVWARDVFQGIE